MKIKTILISILIMSIIIPNIVKADTYVRGVDTPWKDGSGTALPKNGPFHYINKLSNTTVNGGFEVSEFYLTSSQQVDLTNIKGGTVEIPFYVSATIVVDNTQNEVICSRWTQDSMGRWVCNGYENYTAGTIQVQPTINVWTMIVYASGYTDMCTIDQANNKIKCPVAQLNNQTDKLWFIQVRTQLYYGDSYPRQGYTVGLGDKVNLYKNDFIGLQENQNQNTQTIIDTNTTYNNQASENITGQQDMDDFDDEQRNILSNLDFSGVNETGNITVNSNANSYIWSIANRLRGMNIAIVTLITSILGIGIIKMVLNR